MLDASVQWRVKAGSLDLEEPGYASTVEGILSAGLATEVVRVLSAGKEADVYLAGYNGAPLAIKAYRLYRTYHRGGRPIKLDSMSWKAAHEYEMLRQAWKGGVRVPTPAKRVENLLAMRYLGDENRCAPRLVDVRVDDPEALLAQVLDGVEGLARAGVVHSDMSAFNILLYRGEPWFIDFSGALRVDRLGSASWRRLTAASDLLRMGLESLRSHFRRYGQPLDVESVVTRIIESLDRFQVLR